MELERALYVAENKNDSAVYTEWVHFDKERFAQLLDRAQRLIEATTPPWRISTDPEFFECKYCSMWKHCHGGLAAEANCRTCCHSSPVENAAWHCKPHNKVLSVEDQNKGCNIHLMTPTRTPKTVVRTGSLTSTRRPATSSSTAQRALKSTAPRSAARSCTTAQAR